MNSAEGPHGSLLADIAEAKRNWLALSYSFIYLMVGFVFFSSCYKYLILLSFSHRPVVVGFDTLNISQQIANLKSLPPVCMGNWATATDEQVREQLASGTTYPFRVPKVGSLKINDLIRGEGMQRCVNEVGIGFMMAANYHPAIRIVRPIRKKLKVKIVFIVLVPC
ncbi:hypothetical protein ACFE04_026423 [Oxalis oulophora]